MSKYNVCFTCKTVVLFLFPCQNYISLNTRLWHWITFGTFYARLWHLVHFIQDCDIWYIWYILCQTVTFGTFYTRLWHLIHFMSHWHFGTFYARMWHLVHFMPDCDIWYILCQTVSFLYILCQTVTFWSI